MARPPLSLTPTAILDAQWEELGIEDDRQAQALLMHAHLLALRRVDARVDLALAAGLRRFRRGGDCDFGDAGHSNASDECDIRLGFSWSHARELIDIFDGLERLPAMRAAFLAGHTGRSKLRALVRAAESATERGWLDWSARRSTRTVENAVARFRETGSAPAAVHAPAEPKEEPARARFTGTHTEITAWKVLHRDLLELVTGERVSEAEALELLAGDMLARADAAPEHPQECVHDVPRTRRTRPRGAPDRASLVALGARWRATGDPALVELPDATLPRGAMAVIHVLRQIVAIREQVGFERARLLWLLDGRGLHRELGARSLHDYAAHALDMAPREVRAALDLQTRLANLPRLSAALAAGDVTTRCVRLVSRVVVPDTDADWTRQCVRASLKRIEKEVAWHELKLALLPLDEYLALTHGGRPRLDLGMAALHVDALAALGVRARERALRTGAEPDGDEILLPELPRWARLSSFSVALEPEALRVIRAALAVARTSAGLDASDAGCLLAGLRQFAHDNIEPDLGKSRISTSFEILDRDGWECASALCRRRRGFHVHHIQFRSRGGGDEPENLTTLCVRCHRLLHRGTLVITGSAPGGLVLIVAGTEVWREGMRERAA